MAVKIYQFEKDIILVQDYALAIGPYHFDLSGMLPAGDDLSACAVKSYLDDEDETETTTDLISGTPSILGNVVSLFFDYPGDSLKGDHKLTFQFTLVSGAKDEADFWKVEVGSV